MGKNCPGMWQEGDPYADTQMLVLPHICGYKEIYQINQKIAGNKNPERQAMNKENFAVNTLGKIKTLHTVGVWESAF